MCARVCVCTRAYMHVGRQGHRGEASGNSGCNASLTSLKWKRPKGTEQRSGLCQRRTAQQERRRLETSLAPEHQPVLSSTSISQRRCPWGSTPGAWSYSGRRMLLQYHTKGWWMERGIALHRVREKLIGLIVRLLLDLLTDAAP